MQGIAIKTFSVVLNIGGSVGVEILSNALNLVVSLTGTLFMTQMSYRPMHALFGDCTYPLERNFTGSLVIVEFEF